MSIKRYRRPFWLGLLHALSIVLYCVFISLIWLSLATVLNTLVQPAITMIAFLFIGILSAAVIAYFIFFEPFKYIVHHHFKQATVLIMSTFGWLFVFFAIFIFGFFITVYS